MSSPDEVQTPDGVTFLETAAAAAPVGSDGAQVASAAATGALAASWIPGIGTAVGAAVGALVGLGGVFARRSREKKAETGGYEYVPPVSDFTAEAPSALPAIAATSAASVAAVAAAAKLSGKI
jgi:hypothetical protein